jgi:site-specific recombinase XerD
MYLNKAIDVWQADLARRSANTRRLYRIALGHLQEYLKSEGRDPETMPADTLMASHILGCVRALNVSGLATSSVHAYITGLMSFIRFLIINELGEFDEMDLVKLRERIANIAGRQPTRRLPRAVSDKDVQALLRAARSAPDHTLRLSLLRSRNLALLHTLRSTGARVSEAVNLRLGDLRAEDVAAVVMGKGSKERLVFFDETAWDALRDYLTAREVAGETMAEETPLFTRHDRQAGKEAETISTTTVRNVLADLCKEAGLGHTITPHQFRHRLAIRVLANSNLAVTQDVLGHANPATTRVYTRMAPEALRKAVISAGGFA